MKITFVRDTRRSEHGRGKGERGFAAGQTVDVPDATASRWIRRGAAVDQETVKRLSTEAKAAKKAAKKGDG